MVGVCELIILEVEATRTFEDTFVDTFESTRTVLSYLFVRKYSVTCRKGDPRTVASYSTTR
jgi:hypothetical protein